MRRRALALAQSLRAEFRGGRRGDLPAAATQTLCDRCCLSPCGHRSLRPAAPAFWVPDSTRGCSHLRAGCRATSTTGSTASQRRTLITGLQTLLVLPGTRSGVRVRRCGPWSPSCRCTMRRRRCRGAKTRSLVRTQGRSSCWSPTHHLDHRRRSGGGKCSRGGGCSGRSSRSDCGTDCCRAFCLAWPRSVKKLFEIFEHSVARRGTREGSKSALSVGGHGAPIQ